MKNRHSIERARARETWRIIRAEVRHELYPKVEKESDLLAWEVERVQKVTWERVGPLLNRAQKRALGTRGYGHGLGDLATSIRTRRR